MSAAGDDDAIHRELDTDRDEPTLAIAEVVADVEDRDVTSVATVYDCLDDVLETVFSNPPSEEADLQVSFSYEGYRIVVDQDGSATFVEEE